VNNFLTAQMAIASYTHSFFNDGNSANIASARAGNVIGGGDWAEKRIVPDCVRTLEKSDPIIIRNPNAVRPWQHVLEPLSGYLKLGFLLYTDAKKFTGPWNFGPSSKNIVTVKELTEKVVKNWGHGRISSESENNKFSEANLLHLDISKAVNKLKWQPKLDFDDTVSYTIDEYRINEMKKRKYMNNELSILLDTWIYE
jgi:CDP-glucose 4,6-dehydratase